MEISSYTQRYGQFIRVSDDSGDSLDSWRILEELGYVITTEECRDNDVENEVLTYIVGQHLNGNGNDYFCRGNHD